MTPQEWIKKQRQNAEKLVQDFGLAVAHVHGLKMQRIFEQGGLGNSGKQRFKYNSTNPLYVNPKTSPRGFPPAGKPGSKRKGQVTRYFGSYKDFRNTIGRQTSFVDLKLGGTLQKDWSNGIQKVSNTRYVTGTKNPKNGDKLAGHLEKYGRFNSLTEEEKKKYVEFINAQRKKLGV